MAKSGEDDHYVTHEELNYTIDKLSNKIDLLDAHLDTKFASQKTCTLTTMLTIASVAAAAIGLLIHFL